MLSTKLLVVFFFITFQQSSVLASLNLHGQPLFSGVTEFTFEVATSTLTKATPCYITEGKISQCRRKRGMEEKPQIQLEGLDIAPSAVMGVEATPAPRSPKFNSKDFKNHVISSSFDDAYFNNMNLFRQLAATNRNNVVTVGDCGMSTVNFSQFLSCLGMTVQETNDNIDGHFYGNLDLLQRLQHNDSDGLHSVRFLLSLLSFKFHASSADFPNRR
uniref:Uncharacterized protein n=1 Tax=Daphnia galeata TaxID=27404 RepID=A0A8J2RBU9_9CRUS|nr:unnamed protein product [Daphnia galeata]